METPLVASATSAGAIFSGSTFTVPAYQREYAWTRDEVMEFWEDLRSGLEDNEYFLGLVIFTDELDRKQVVDGQQRLLTITALVAALFHEATAAGRRALADRLQADFLTAIDYATDAEIPRVSLTDIRDEKTLRSLVAHGKHDTTDLPHDDESISPNLIDSYRVLRGVAATRPSTGSLQAPRHMGRFPYESTLPRGIHPSKPRRSIPSVRGR